jgi:hypothetical protein
LKFVTFTELSRKDQIILHFFTSLAFLLLVIVVNSYASDLNLAKDAEALSKYNLKSFMLVGSLIILYFMFSVSQLAINCYLFFREKKLAKLEAESKKRKKKNPQDEIYDLKIKKE